MRKKLALILLLLLIPLLLLSAKDKPKFALVLGGGGARGYAHIPVIQELERRGIVPDLVVGTSMGALIGGFYASGWTGEDLMELVLENDINSLVSSYNINTGKMELVTPDSEIIANIASINFGDSGLGAVNGLISDQKINGFIRNNLSKVLSIEDFDDLSIPFRATGTNAEDQSIIVFEDGDLFTALRASMSIPLAFPPVQLDEDTYVMDGGMADNLPVDIARELGADIVLAVDVNDALRQNGNTSPDKFKTLTGAFDMFSSMITVSNMIPNYEMADLVLVPKVDEYSTLDFSKADEIMALGREEVERHMAFFDWLEEELKDKDNEFLTYSQRPSVEIVSIDKSGVVGFDNELDAFIGKEINNINMRKFEELLSLIVEASKLKSLSYNIDNDGHITLKPESYQPMSGYLAVGLDAELGLLYDGINNPFFGYNAHVSIGAQYFLHQKSLFSLGILYNDSFKIEGRYSLPIMRDAYFGVGLDFNYLNLGISTITTSYGFQVGNDIGLETLFGFFYDPQGSVTTSLSISYNFTHLGKVLNPNDRTDFLVPDNDNGFLALKGAIKYSKENNIGFEYTLDTALQGSIGLDYTYNGEEGYERRPLLGYTLTGKLDSSFGGSTFKGFFETEFDVLRRYPMLKEAFVTTKSGTLTPDYVFGVLGARIDIPSTKIYLKIGGYVEGYQHNLDKTSDYWKKYIRQWPFGTIDDVNGGVMLQTGYKTSVGDFLISAYLGVSVKEGFNCSVMFGFR